MSKSQPPTRVLDGELYVYEGADLSRITTELYTRLSEMDDISDETAETAAEATYDLLTGDWASQ